MRKRPSFLSPSAIAGAANAERGKGVMLTTLGQLPILPPSRYSRRTSALIVRRTPRHGAAHANVKSSRRPQPISGSKYRHRSGWYNRKRSRLQLAAHGTSPLRCAHCVSGARTTARQLQTVSQCVHLQPLGVQNATSTIPRPVYAHVPQPLQPSQKQNAARVCSDDASAHL